MTDHDSKHNVRAKIRECVSHYTPHALYDYQDSYYSRQAQNMIHSLQEVCMNL